MLCLDLFAKNYATILYAYRQLIHMALVAAYFSCREWDDWIELRVVMNHYEFLYTVLL